jgi:ATP-dependent helicase/nuclease subunit A
MTGARDAAGALDFSDLIVRAGALLLRQHQPAWVLFKLDGGVDHLLIDEARDTSPEQWAIMTALVAEFFSGEDGRERRLQRTVFVVGDEKQSIFSYKGAAPPLLLAQSQRSRPWPTGPSGTRGAQLNMSWRSTPRCWRSSSTCSRPDRAGRLAPHPRGRVGRRGGEAHGPARRRTRAASTTGRRWSTRWRPTQRDPVDATQYPAWRTLAERIAVECEAMVRRGDRVKDRKGWRPVDFGDILILVRRRGALFEETLRELKRRGVPVAGARPAEAVGTSGLRGPQVTRPLRATRGTT